MICRNKCFICCILGCNQPGSESSSLQPGTATEYCNPNNNHQE